MEYLDSLFGFGLVICDDWVYCFMYVILGGNGYVSIHNVFVGCIFCVFWFLFFLECGFGDFEICMVFIYLVVCYFVNGFFLNFWRLCVSCFLWCINGLGWVSNGFRKDCM